MRWPFKKKKPRLAQQGSFMNESGILPCPCGEKIPVVLACHLPSVPVVRFANMRAPRVVLDGIPCPKCDRSHSATMHPGQHR